MRGFMMVSVLALLAGCGDDTIEKGRAAAAFQLKDPGSAQFRGDYVTSTGSVCGEINGKNSFGAYVGFKRYLSMKGKGGDFIAVIDSEESSSTLDILCTKPIKT